MNTPPKLSFACPMLWTRMSGTERSRFCQQCGHHVRNLSLMSAAERADLQQRAKTERICGTYYVRLSGEMVTPAAPLTPSEWGRIKQFGVAALSAGALVVAAGCISTPTKESSMPPPIPDAVAASCETSAVQPTAAAEKKGDEEIIQLTGFYVTPTQDEAYHPVPPLNGTRLKTH